MGSNAMANSMRSKNKTRSEYRSEYILSNEQTLDALSPPNILMTGTNESKVDSMKDRFNFDSGVAADSGNKRSAGTANGQT